MAELVKYVTILFHFQKASLLYTLLTLQNIGLGKLDISASQHALLILSAELTLYTLSMLYRFVNRHS